MTEYFQEIIYDMKTVRHLSELGIIFTDELLREAGRKGAIAGDELRKRFADYFYDEFKKIGVSNDLEKLNEIYEPVCIICGHKLIKED